MNVTNGVNATASPVVPPRLALPPPASLLKRWAMWTCRGRPEPSRPVEPIVRRKPRVVDAASQTRRRRLASIGRTFVRVTAVALFFVVIALAARPFGAIQPLTIPIVALAVAGLRAAAVNETNRGRPPLRLQGAQHGPTTNGGNDRTHAYEEGLR